MTPENLDDLKKAWYAMGRSLGMPMPDEDPENLQKKKTTLDRLRNDYRRFQFLAILFAIVGLFVFPRASLFGRYGLWLGIAYAAYFLVNSCLDWWLWKGLSKIDPITMGAAQVAQKALYYRKCHLLMIAFMVPIAVVLLCFMGYTFADNGAMIAGMVAGGIIGLIIGLNQLRKFMACYKRLSQ